MDLYQKYLSLVYRYLNFRPRSEEEVRNKLKEKQAPQDIIEKVIAKLKDQKFINDEEFARLWIYSRSRTKPRSKFLLQQELRKKGITKRTIQKILTGANTLAIINDEEMAIKVIKRKIDRYKGLEKQKLYSRLGGLLSRRGFSWGVSKKAIDAVLEEEYNKAQ